MKPCSPSAAFSSTAAGSTRASPFSLTVCGSAGGISISYALGTRFGHRFVTYVRLSPAWVLKTEQMFLRFGPVLLTIGYFIPGVRHFTAVVAGMSRLRFRKFALFAYSGAVIWVTLFLTLGYIFGNGWQHTSDLVHRYTLIATGIAAAAILIVWLVRHVRRQNSVIMEPWTTSFYEEICRVYEQFRIANLNVRYYGSLAQSRKNWSTRVQISVAVLSVFSLVVLAAPEFRAISSLAVSAAVASGLAAVLSGAIPFFGFDEDSKKYALLNRSYQIVENQLKDTLVLLRRSDVLSQELLGRVSVVLDSMSRLQSLDEEEYSPKGLAEKGRIQEEVNKAFPADYVWNNL